MYVCTVQPIECAVHGASGQTRVKAMEKRENSAIEWTSTSAWMPPIMMHVSELVNIQKAYYLFYDYL